MRLTRIEQENRDYFSYLCPDSLLNDDGLFKLGVIDDEDYACSMCVIGIGDSLAHIRWIMTDPGSREKGAATFLIDNVLELLKDTGVDGIDVRFMSSDEDLDDFLEERGFLVDEDTGIYSIPIPDLVYSREMEQITGSIGASRHTKPFPDDDAVRGKLIRKLSESFQTDPHVFDGISPKYSAIYYDTGSHPSGVICVSESGDKDLYVNYLFSGGGINCIGELVTALYDAIIQSGSLPENLIFTDRDDRSITLMESLTGIDRDEYRIPGHMYALMLF